MEIREIKYAEIKEIFGKLDSNLITNPKARYLTLFINNKPISLCGVLKNHKGVKIQTNYTFPKERGNGYFGYLLKDIIAKYDCNIFADCLDASFGVYLKYGFELLKIKEFKKFKIYYMVLKNEKICKEN
jgi:hypothetical protein